MSKRLECMDEWMDSINSSIHWIPLWNVMTTTAPAALIAILLQKVSYFPSNEYFSPLQTYPICNTCPGTLIMILLLSSKLLAWDLSRDPLMGQRPLKWTSNGPPSPDWFEFIFGVTSLGTSRGLWSQKFCIGFINEANSRPYFGLPWPLLPTQSILLVQNGLYRCPAYSTTCFMPNSPLWKSF